LPRHGFGRATVLRENPRLDKGLAARERGAVQTPSDGTPEAFGPPVTSHTTGTPAPPGVGANDHLIDV
jgi:hypothetical protein